MKTEQIIEMLRIAYYWGRDYGSNRSDMNFNDLLQMQEIKQFLSTQADGDNPYCKWCGKPKRVTNYRIEPLCECPPTDDKVVDAGDWLCKYTMLYKGTPSLIPAMNSNVLIDMMNEFKQSQPDNQFLKGIEYAIRHFDIKDPEALLKKGRMKDLGLEEQERQLRGEVE